MKVWLVTKSAHDEDHDWVVVLGIYGDRKKAEARVTEVFSDIKDSFKEKYEKDEIETDTYAGYAEIRTIGDAFEAATVKAVDYELDRKQFDLID